MELTLWRGFFEPLTLFQNYRNSCGFEIKQLTDDCNVIKTTDLRLTVANLNKDVLERHTPTRSGRHCIIGQQFFPNFLATPLSKSKDTYQDSLLASGYIKREKASLPLMCVVQKRLWLSSLVYCYDVGCKAHSLSYDSFKRRRSHQKQR